MGSGLATPGTKGQTMIPLAIEAELFALSGFALGLLLAYIGELRRRANQYKKRI